MILKDTGKRFLFNRLDDRSPQGVAKGIILFGILAVIISFGFIGYLPSLVSALQEGRTLIWVALTLAYALLILLIVLKSISFHMRALCVCAIIFLVGVTSFSVAELVGTGRLWFVCASILACLLLGFRTALIFALLSLGFMITFAYLKGFTVNLPQESDLAIWWIVLSSFTLVQIILIGGATLLVNGLTQSLQREKSLVRDKEAANQAKSDLLANMSHEITERKQAEEALRESETRYKTFINSTSDFVFLKDEQLNHIVVNNALARYFGKKPEEVIGLSDFDLLPEEAATSCRNSDANAMATNKTYITEEPIGDRVFETLKFPVLLENNKIGVGGYIRDITERKQAEADRDKLQMQLIQSQKLESVGRLAGGVAHDFNNMLSVILGNTEIVLQEVDSTQPLYDNFLEIQSAARRSAHVVRQLLAFARRQTIAPQVLDLNEIVEEMLKILRRLIGEDIDLSWQPGHDIWPIKMDPAQIDQILANLSVNARDAIHGVGKLILETGRATFDEAYCAENQGFVPGDYVLLSVSDNGKGMDRETLENIFEPFFTTKEVGQGTGLGLATVYGIVKQNNGFIHVYSEPNQGTTFKIYLPRHRTADEPARPKPTEAFEAHGYETILLVEDEATILKMTRKMLERLGYTVLTAAAPEEAIDVARDHGDEIRLLMTDVVMPEMNGRDLAEKLLSLYPNLKWLFMSGYTEDVIAHHGVLDEGVHFIQKPFSMQDLAAKVRKILDG